MTQRSAEKLAKATRGEESEKKRKSDLACAVEVGAEAFRRFVGSALFQRLLCDSGQRHVKCRRISSFFASPSVKNIQDDYSCPWNTDTDMRRICKRQEMKLGGVAKYSASSSSSAAMRQSVIIVRSSATRKSTSEVTAVGAKSVCAASSVAICVAASSETAPRSARRRFASSSTISATLCVRRVSTLHAWYCSTRLCKLSLRSRFSS